MDKNEQGFIILSDTDSLFICLTKVLDFLESKGIEINSKNKNKIILNLAQSIQKDANDNLNSLVDNLFNIKNNKYFQLKQEVIASTILTTGKRRYGMYVTNKEGVEVEELDLKGLEIMKSNMNKRFKSFGENFIKQILFGLEKNKLDQLIIDFKQSLQKLEPHLLGKPTGVSYINKCIKKKALAGEIFSELELKTAANSKAAIRYNDLLKFKKLDKKYESIIEGDKIFIVNLKNNPYCIDTIAIPNGKFPTEIDTLIREYIDFELIFESMIGKKLKELYSDLNWDYPSFNKNVSKFIKFG